MTTVDLKQDVLVTAGTVFAHYSMPDFIGSKFLRFIGKTAVNTGLVAWMASQDQAELSAGLNNVKEFLDNADGDDLKTAAGVVGAVTMGGTILAIAGEKWIFRRAERKRVNGKRLPHTKQALVLAALTAGGMVLANKVDG